MQLCTPEVGSASPKHPMHLVRQQNELQDGCGWVAGPPFQTMPRRQLRMAGGLLGGLTWTEGSAIRQYTCAAFSNIVVVSASRSGSATASCVEYEHRMYPPLLPYGDASYPNSLQRPLHSRWMLRHPHRS
jgi:hypothetical protein